MTKTGAFIGFLLMALTPIRAQDTMRASIRGNSNNGQGKCTIEVNIDGSAEVSISGDTARLRTLGGQRAEWRRFECNGVMPRQVGDFRFSGIDGRGRQTLIRDPRQSRGTAVVRLDDPQGGREGYTFDIEWRTGFGGGIGPGYPGGGGSSNTYIVNCASRGRRRSYCRVDARRGVRLVRETGGVAAAKGLTGVTIYEESGWIAVAQRISWCNVKTLLTINLADDFLKAFFGGQTREIIAL